LKRFKAIDLPSGPTKSVVAFVPSKYLEKGSGSLFKSRLYSSGQNHSGLKRSGDKNDDVGHTKRPRSEDNNEEEGSSHRVLWLLYDKTLHAIEGGLASSLPSIVQTEPDTSHVMVPSPTGPSVLEPIFRLSGVYSVTSSFPKSGKDFIEALSPWDQDFLDRMDLT